MDLDFASISSDMSQRSTAQHCHIDTPFCTIRKSHFTWNFAVPGPHSEEIRRCILLFLCTLANTECLNSCSWCVCCLILQFLHFYFSHDLFACHWTYLKYSSETQTHCPLRLSWLWLVWSRTVKLQRPGTSVSSFFPDKWSAVTRHSEKGSPQKLLAIISLIWWSGTLVSILPLLSFVADNRHSKLEAANEWPHSTSNNEQFKTSWYGNESRLVQLVSETITNFFLWVLNLSSLSWGVLFFFFFSCKEVTVIICILAWCPPLFILRFLPLYPTLVYRHGQVTVCRCPLPRH